jgi:eukaryotic-like serine/threonine-protein kinase
MLERLRELEPGLRPAQPRATPGDTVVIGALDGAPTAETRVLSSTGRMAVAVAAASGDDGAEGDAATLTDLASRRRRRGYWILALILLVTGLAAGTGWYFGAGPGSLATVPDTTGMLPDNATQVLEEAGFQVEPAERHDPEVPTGQVSGTDPEDGALTRRGSTVQLFVSLGPQMLDVPQVAGMPEADARTALEAFTVAEDSAEQFSGDVEAGTVIAVLDASGSPVGATHPERGELTLVVSVGAVPPVEGLAVGEAQARLEEAGLTVELADPQYSDDVPVDVVITADWLDDPMNPGDVVRLTVSQGPEPVEVPNVVGATMSDAVATLEAAGFSVSYELPDIFLPLATVKEQSPAAGEVAARGSSVRIVGSLTL